MLARAAHRRLWCCIAISPSIAALHACIIRHRLRAAYTYLPAGKSLLPTPTHPAAGPYAGKSEFPAVRPCWVRLWWEDRFSLCQVSPEPTRACSAVACSSLQRLQPTEGEREREREKHTHHCTSGGRSDSGIRRHGSSRGDQGDPGEGSEGREQAMDKVAGLRRAQDGRWPALRLRR